MASSVRDSTGESRQVLYCHDLVRVFGILKRLSDIAALEESTIRTVKVRCREGGRLARVGEHQQLAATTDLIGQLAVSLWQLLVQRSRHHCRCGVRIGSQSTDNLSRLSTAFSAAAHYSHGTGMLSD